MEAENDKFESIQRFNSLIWGNHIFNLCKFEPVEALCGYDQPFKSHIDYDGKAASTTATKVYYLIICTSELGMVSSTQLIKNAMFSKKLTLNLLQNSMHKSIPKVARFASQHCGILDTFNFVFGWLHIRYWFWSGCCVWISWSNVRIQKLRCIQLSSANTWMCLVSKQSLRNLWNERTFYWKLRRCFCR